MAIEPVKHLTLLAPRGTVAQLTDWLQQLAVIHVEDAAKLVDDDEKEAIEFDKPAIPTEDIDNRITELRQILGIFDSFGALESSFIEMMVALPNRVSMAERKHVVSEFDYRPLWEEVRQLEKENHQHETAIEQAKEEYEQLEFFRLLPFEPEDIQALKRVKVWIGSMMADKWEDMKASGDADDICALTELRKQKRFVDICAVALNEDSEEVGRLLRSYGFSESAVPQYEGTRRERMDALMESIESHHRESLRCRAEVKKLAEKSRQVEILLGYWEAEQAKVRAQNSTLNSNRIAMLTGYIRVKDVDSFQGRLQQNFPNVSAVYRDPTPQDDVPVDISNAEYLKPLRFLVDLFGRPDYFSFDPTPYLAISFLIFFGMCFSDVVYGAGLAVIGYILARKARPYAGLYKLCMLFCYAGIFTTIIGLLMGSWASDLPKYFGEDNIIYRLQQSFAIVNPIEQAVLMLVVSIAIGIINQFYGIALKAYGLIRKGRILDALYDAGLWYIVLPGFLIVSGSLFFDIPSWALNVGFGMLIAGGIGLVFTQGRDADGLAAKFGAGLISIYGIMGSYGCVSFLSDILSYSRLIALGLTTSIVGLAVNIIAKLVRDEIPAVGIVLFVVVLVVGHIFNFLVSMLAAFVHPARLIFLEFFNRFYESGGVEFTPLSLSTKSMIVEPDGEE
jgi:V/A-type H+-transporting ATPase subunit I